MTSMIPTFLKEMIAAAVFALLPMLLNALVVRPPALNSTDATAMFVFSPGSSISPEQYVPLMKQIQAKALESGLQLYVGMPQFMFDIWWTDTEFEAGLQRALSELIGVVKADGVYSESIPVFYGGHSRGAATLQEVWMRLEKVRQNPSLQLRFQRAETEENVLLKHPNAGMVFMAAAVKRRFRSDTSGRFLSDSLPYLTIGGELDGLYRVTRVAETYWHQQIKETNVSKAEAPFWHPVLVVKGASHQSFFSGEPSFFVNWNDLKPEVSQDEAHSIISQWTADFLLFHTRNAALQRIEEAKARFQVALNAASAYFQPLMDAYLLEGSYHLRPPCSQVQYPGQECWEGSFWTEQVQRWLVDLPKITMNVTDSFYRVWLIPFHLPDIKNKCQKPDESCQLDSTTITQLTYSVVDFFDTGFTPCAADEMRVKFKSKQAFHQAAGIKNANFTELDDNNWVCSKLNQISLDWALKNANADALKRYYSKGMKLVMGEDKGPYVGGVQWIWEPLAFEKLPTVSGERPLVSVRSPNMRTPTDYPIGLAAGFHYCKLLSPAKALEWIYIDSLKQ